MIGRHLTWDEIDALASATEPAPHYYSAPTIAGRVGCQFRGRPGPKACGRAADDPLHLTPPSAGCQTADAEAGL